MRTTKPTLNKADLILTGDWHLLETNPICRLDDLTKTQWSKVNFVFNVQKEHNCPVIHSGDLFDYWKPSPELLSKTIEHLPNNFWTVYGNHDLPQHNLDLSYKSGINVLEKAGKLGVLKGTHWGQKPFISTNIMGPVIKNINEPKKILVWHVLTYQNVRPYPGCTLPKASRLLKKYTDFDLIVTGHNHKPFVEHYAARLLVNPGSLLRLTAAQQDHKPRVYLYYSNTNTVLPVYIPINENVISREHIELIEKRDKRINEFVTKLNDTRWDSKLSFEENLEIFFTSNKTPDFVKSIIYKAIDSSI